MTRKVINIFLLSLALSFSACIDEKSEDLLTAEDESASANECGSGRICFWDDNGFSDTFKYRTVSLADFNNINFGDKATSVLNRMTVAWLLYDDAGYSDTCVCVMAGASVANLGNFGFNDKTSSAWKLAGNTCPSGVLAFDGVN